MKIEKIIETIKIAATEVEWNYPLDYTIALNEAAELLEKQIPKKPIYNDYGYNGFDEFLPNCAKCPNCGREIPYGTWNYEDSHHCECGQALDWGEENK